MPNGPETLIGKALKEINTPDPITGKPKIIKQQPIIGDYFLTPSDVSAKDVINLNVTRNFDISPENIQDIKAARQGFWAMAGNSLVQVVSEIGLGTLEGIGYLLDLETIFNYQKQAEEGFGNWFSNAMRDAKESIKEAFPVEVSTENQGFAPWSAEWWASNAPSIASTLTLMVPSIGATKLLGTAGKALRLTDALGDLGKTGKMAVKGISTAIISRYMENTLEAREVYDKSLEKYLRSGFSHESAAIEAGKDASLVWKANWINLASDVFEYMTLFKGIGRTADAINIGKKVGKGAFFGDLAKTMVSEGLEEGIQYGIQTEAPGSEGVFEIYGKIADNFGKYFSDDEFKTAVTLGAVGGGLFTAAGKGVEKLTERINKSIRDSVLGKNYQMKDLQAQYNKHRYNRLITMFEEKGVDEVMQMAELAKEEEDVDVEFVSNVKTYGEKYKDILRALDGLNIPKEQMLPTARRELEKQIMEDVIDKAQSDIITLEKDVDLLDLTHAQIEVIEKSKMPKNVKKVLIEDLKSQLPEGYTPTKRLEDLSSITINRLQDLTIVKRDYAAKFGKDAKYKPIADYVASLEQQIEQSIQEAEQKSNQQPTQQTTQQDVQQAVQQTTQAQPTQKKKTKAELKNEEKPQIKKEELPQDVEELSADDFDFTPEEVKQYEADIPRTPPSEEMSIYDDIPEFMKSSFTEEEFESAIRPYKKFYNSLKDYDKELVRNAFGSKKDIKGMRKFLGIVYTNSGGYRESTTEFNRAVANEILNDPKENTRNKAIAKIILDNNYGGMLIEDILERPEKAYKDKVIGDQMKKLVTQFKTLQSQQKQTTQKQTTQQQQQPQLQPPQQPQQTQQPQQQVQPTEQLQQEQIVEESKEEVLDQTNEQAVNEEIRTIEQIINQGEVDDDPNVNILYKRVVDGYNKLAFLSRNYTYKVTFDEANVPTISIEDTEDVLNALSEHDILDYEKYKAGEEISFEVLNDDNIQIYLPFSKTPVKWGDYKKTISPNSVEYIDNIPIVARDSNGKIIAYLHSTPWMNRLNIKGDVGKNRNNIRKIRKVIVESKTPVKTKITTRKGGVFFRLKERIPVSKAIKNPKIAIYDGKNWSTSLEKPLVNKNVTPGQPYIIAPYDAERNVAIPVNNTKLSDNDVDLLFHAISIYTAPNLNQLSPEALKIHQTLLDSGVNLLDPNQFKSFFEGYVQSVIVPKQIIAAASNKKFISPLHAWVISKVNSVATPGVVTPDKSFFRITPKGVEFTIGTTPFFIGRSKPLTEELSNNLAEALSKAYYNVKKDNFGKQIPIVNISYDEQTDQMIDVTVQTKSYEEVTAERLNTNLLFPEVNGKTISIIQPVIRFDTSFAFEEKPLQVTEESKVENIDSIPEDITFEEIVEESENVEDVLDADELKELEDSINDIDIDLSEENFYHPLSSQFTFKNEEQLKSILRKSIIPGLLPIQQESTVTAIAESIVRTLFQKGELNKAKYEAIIKWWYKKFEQIKAEKGYPVDLSIAQKFDKPIKLKDGTKIVESKGITIGEDTITVVVDNNGNLETTTIPKRPNDVSQHIDLYLNNWDVINSKVLTYLKSRSGIELKTYSNEEFSDTEVVVDERGESFERKDYSDDFVFTVNRKTKMLSDLKRFFSFIPYSDNPSESVTYLGFKKFANFDDILNTLFSVLTDRNLEYEDLITTIRSEINKPWVEPLIRAIENSPQSRKNAIVSLFKMHKTKMKYVFIDNRKTNKVFIVDSNASSVANVLQDEWYTKFKLSPYVKIDLQTGRSYVDSDSANEILGKIRDAFKNQDIDSVRNVFEALGIKLSDRAYQELETEGLVFNGKKISFKQLFDKTKGGFFFGFGEAFQLVNLTDEGRIYLDEQTFISNSGLLSSRVKSIARVEAKYNNTVVPTSFKAGQKSVWQFGLNRYYTNRFLQLKGNVGGILTSLKQLPYLKDSKFLQDIIDNVENFDYFYVDIGSPLNIKNGKRANDKASNLTEDDNELIRVSMFQNRGSDYIYVTYPTLSDKSTLFGLKIKKPIKNVLDQNGKLSEEALNMLYEEIFLSEYKMLKQLNEKPSGNAIIDSGRNIILSFPSVNNIEGLRLPDGSLASIENNPVLQQKIKDEILKTVNDLMNKKYFYWQKIGIKSYFDSDYLSTLKYKDKFKEAVADYVVNQMIAYNGIFATFTGMPINFYKKASKNKGKSLTDPDYDFIQDAIETYDNMGKRLAADNTPGYEGVNSNKEYKVAVLKDNEEDSAYVQQFMELFEKNGIDKSFADSYKKINTADAQEFTTWKEHLDLLFDYGKITEKQYNELKDKLSKGIDLSIEELKTVMQPMKPVQVAMLNNGVIESKVFIKSASIPLVPQLTKGLPIDRLRVKMETEGIDRVAFESAVKTGTPKEKITLFDSNGQLNDFTFNENNTITLKREHFRIPQEQPFDETKSKITMGTQTISLIFRDALDMTFNYNGKKVKGSDLKKEYLKTLNSIFQNALTEFYEEIEYNPETETYNVKKLIDVLTKEAIKRGYDINTIESLTALAEAESLSYILSYKNKAMPLWALPSASKIESFIVSIIDGKVRKQKFRGGSFILGSSTIVKGFDELDQQTKTGIIKVEGWDGELKHQRIENGKVQPSEILVPQFLRNADGTLLDLSEYVEDGVLKLDKIDPKALEAFMFRIPTQGFNSMNYAKVVGFLPNISGNMIVVPKESVTQTGEDFDFDKKYVYFYNTFKDAKGNIRVITRENKNEVVNHLLGIGDFLTVLKELFGEDIYDADKASKLDNDEKIRIIERKVDNMILQNELLDIQNTVMSNPEVLARTLTPLAYGEILSLKEEIESQSKKEFILPLSDEYQRMKYNNAAFGKRAVGLFAIDSAFLNMIQTTDGKDIKLVTFENGKKQPFTFRIDSSVSNGVISDVKTLDGKNYKSEIVSAFLSTAVDNEKLQAFHALGMNLETYKMAQLLIYLGFNEEQIVYFIKQPIIQELATLTQSGVTSQNKTLEEAVTILADKYGIESLSNLSREFTLKELKDAALGKMDVKSDQFKNLQAKALYAYVSAQPQIRALQNLKRKSRLLSSGVGKDMITAVELFNMSSFESHVEGFENVFKMDDTDTVANITIETVLKPTLNIFGSVYPYNSPVIFKSFETLSKTSKTGELGNWNFYAKRIFQNIKGYFFSKIFDNPELVREKLMYRKGNNTPLADYVMKAKELYPNNQFLQRLKTEIEKNPDAPNLITFINAISEEFDENAIYTAFNELYMNERVIQDDYTTKDLVADLIAYSFITGGTQGASNFIKYVPVAYLNDLGYTEKINSIDWVNMSDEEFAHIIEQILKNDPTIIGVNDINADLSKAKRIKLNTAISTYIDNAGVITPRPYVTVRSKGNIYLLKKEPDGNYMVLENYHNSPVSVFESYNPPSDTQMIKKEELPKNTVDEITPETINILNTLKQDIEGIVILDRASTIAQEKWSYEKNTRNSIKNLANAVQEGHYLRSIAQWILDNIDNLDINLEFVSGEDVVAYYDQKNDKIIIHEDFLDPTKHNQEVLTEVIFHEIVHMFTVKMIKTNNPNYAVVKTDLQNIYKIAVEKFGGMNKIKEIINKESNQEKKSDEYYIAYSLYSIEEFVANVMTNRPFKNFLKGTFSGKVSLFEKLKAWLQSFLLKFGLDIGGDYLPIIESHVEKLMTGDIKRRQSFDEFFSGYKDTRRRNIVAPADMDNWSDWNKVKKFILDNYPDFTRYDFYQLSEEEKIQLIECIRQR